MTREQKITRARELRAQGWGYHRIAAELGTTYMVIYRGLNPAYDERAQQRSQAYRDAHRDDIRAANNRRYAGTQCKHCGKVTGALDAVGEPCCRTCKRTPPAPVSAATCGRCRAQLLTPAALCGLCVEEISLEHERRRSAA